MVVKSVYKNGRRFYYYGTYEDWDEAYKTINYYKKKTKTKYHVQPRDKGYWFPYKVYDIYFNKIMKLF